MYVVYVFVLWVCASVHASVCVYVCTYDYGGQRSVRSSVALCFLRQYLLLSLKLPNLAKLILGITCLCPASTEVTA